MRAFGLGLAAGAAGSKVGAQVAPAPPTLSDLAERSAQQSPVHLPGQGWFEAAPANGEPDGIMRIAGPEGTHWSRLDRDALRPEWFGGQDDPPDDARLIQRACDHAAQFGLGAVTLGARRWNCLSRIVVDPTATILRGDGATLDFSGLSPSVETEPLATLQDLPEAAGWTHDLGVLRSAYGEADPLQLPLSLNRPGRFRVTFLLAALSGWQDFPALFVEIEDTQGKRQGGVTAVAPGTMLSRSKAT